MYEYQDRSQYYSHRYLHERISGKFGFKQRAYSDYGYIKGWKRVKEK